MDWSKYAQVYDFMSEHNPAYQKLLVELHAFCTSALDGHDERNMRIVDLGAGTGNLTVQLAMSFPKALVMHVEPDIEMLQRARMKSVELGIRNIEFVNSLAEDMDIVAGSIDLVASNHSFYAIKNHHTLVNRIHSWLKPHGHIVVCDFGRKMDTNDWSRYLLGQWFTKYGTWKAIQLALRALSVRESNQEIGMKQLSGEYWTHELEEFVALFKNAKFEIKRGSVTYRGYSDLVVACPIA